MELILERSKQEAAQQEKMHHMNDELIKVMMEIEKQKPEDGWGFKRTALSEEDAKDEQKVFQHLQSNLKQAIKRLEMNNLNKAIQDLNVQSKKQEEPGVDANLKILEQTKSEDQSLDERKARLQNHKDKLIAERNAERKEDLMRQTMTNMKNFDS